MDRALHGDDITARPQLKARTTKERASKGRALHATRLTGASELEVALPAGAHDRAAEARPSQRCRPARIRLTPGLHNSALTWGGRRSSDPCSVDRTTCDPRHCVAALVPCRDHDRTLPSQCDFRFHGREPTSRDGARAARAFQELGAKPAQRSTGRGGYFLNRGSLCESSHSQNSLPLAERMLRAWRQPKHRPTRARA